jgi:hypothetical protein
MCWHPRASLSTCNQQLSICWYVCHRVQCQTATWGVTGLRAAAGTHGPLTAAVTGTGPSLHETGPQQNGTGTAPLRGHVTGQQSAAERATGQGIGRRHPGSGSRMILTGMQGTGVGGTRAAALTRGAAVTGAGEGAGISHSSTQVQVQRGPGDLSCGCLFLGRDKRGRLVRGRLVLALWRRDVCVSFKGFVMLQRLSVVMWSQHQVQLVCDCKGVHTCCTFLVS